MRIPLRGGAERLGKDEEPIPSSHETRNAGQTAPRCEIPDAPSEKQRVPLVMITESRYSRPARGRTTGPARRCRESRRIPSGLRPVARAIGSPNTAGNAEPLIADMCVCSSSGFFPSFQLARTYRRSPIGDLGVISQNVLQTSRASRDFFSLRSSPANWIARLEADEQFEKTKARFRSSYLASRPLHVPNCPSVVNYGLVVFTNRFRGRVVP